MMPRLGGYVPIETMLSIVGDHALGLIRNIAIAGLVMAGADYAMARRRIGKQTRMSKDEVKQENKQNEGDPMPKCPNSSRQLAASRTRNPPDLAQAPLVLANPTPPAD